MFCNGDIMVEIIGWLQNIYSKITAVNQARDIENCSQFLEISWNQK